MISNLHKMDKHCQKKRTDSSFEFHSQNISLLKITLWPQYVLGTHISICSKIWSEDWVLWGWLANAWINSFRCCGCAVVLRPPRCYPVFRVLWDWGGLVADHAAYWGHEVGARFHITLSLRMYLCHCHYRPRGRKELRGLSLVTFNNLSCQEGLESCSDKGLN